VQATDEKLAVRGARIVLVCDTALRAATTAIWLMGMGHRVWVLQGCALSGFAAPEPAAAPSDLAGLVAQAATLLDASKGLHYRVGHVVGATWANRAHLCRERPDFRGPIAVIGRDAALVEGVRLELIAQGHTQVQAALSGPDEWRAAGFKIVQTPDCPAEAECIDHLFFVHDRHDGNLDAALRYLEWETGLLAQLDEDERAALKPLLPKA
jgi:hypothetical protein